MRVKEGTGSPVQKSGGGNVVVYEEIGKRQGPIMPSWHWGELKVHRQNSGIWVWSGSLGHLGMGWSERVK